jgi:hypothetical protein
MASIRSQILDKIEAALGGGAPVYRFSDVPLKADELEAWNITWGAEEVTDEDKDSTVRTLPVELHYAKKGNADNPDTLYDAAYLQAVGVTQDTDVLAAIGTRGEINEKSTAPEVIESDELIYGMTVSFEVIYSTQRGDPTTGA